MTISPPEREIKTVKIVVDRDPVPTSFEKWAKPGHFSRTLAKGPATTKWVWDLHADAHDFDSHTTDLEDISRKVFSAHFGQLGVIFIWLSGMYFHGARFSNYEAWLSDPTHIKPSAQVVWPIVGQEILNGDVGGGFQGVQITSDSSSFGVEVELPVNFNFTVQQLEHLFVQGLCSSQDGGTTTKLHQNLSGSKM